MSLLAELPGRQEITLGKRLILSIPANLQSGDRDMNHGDATWSQKGATLSDKSARQEFGLTQEEIIRAIREGKLQCREGNMHGNPWYRLLRHKVEALVQAQSGEDHLLRKKLQKELSDLNMEGRKLTSRLKAIDRRQAELRAELGESPGH